MGLFGYTGEVDGTYALPSNRVVAGRFTFGGTELLSKLSVYVDSVNANQVTKAVVYGATGSLIAIGEEVLLEPGMSGWVDLPFDEVMELLPGSYDIGLIGGENNKATLLGVNSATGTFKITGANLIPNPSFETNTTGWAVSSPSWTVAAALTKTTSSFTGSDGSSVGRVTATKDATATARTGSVAATTASNTIVPGESYCAAFALKSTDAPASGWQLRIDWYTAAVAYISSSESLNIPAGSATPARFILENAVAPAAAAQATLVIVFNSATSGDVVNFDVDAVQLTAGVTPPSYSGYQGGLITDSYADGPADPEAAMLTYDKTLPIFASTFESWKTPEVEDIQLGRLPWTEAQEAFMGAVTQTQEATTGWHGTRLHPEVGSFALVDSDGPLASLVGDRLRITSGFTSIFVYVVGETELEDDLSLTRRAFLALSSLADDSLDVTVGVVG